MSAPFSAAVRLAPPHNVYADNSVSRFFPGLPDLVLQRTDIGFYCVGAEIGFIEADLGGGNDADASFFCHGTGQAGKADAYAHAALDNGDIGGEVTDVEFWEFHIFPPAEFQKYNTRFFKRLTNTNSCSTLYLL